MNEPRCTCGHYKINHGDWIGDCAIAGCECVLFEPADGTQAATQSSGDNRGGASAKSPSSLPDTGVRREQKDQKEDHGAGLIGQIAAELAETRARPTRKEDILRQLLNLRLA